MKRWEEKIAQLENEAETIFVKGKPEDGQPRNNLESAALELLNAVEKLRLELKRGRIDDALDQMLRIFKNYEEMWILRDVPGYKRRAVITHQLIQDMRRGVVSSKRQKKATLKGAPAIQKKKGKKTINQLRLVIKNLRIKNIPNHNLNKKAAVQLKCSVDHVRRLRRLYGIR